MLLCLFDLVFGRSLVLHYANLLEDPSADRQFVGLKVTEGNTVTGSSEPSLGQLGQGNSMRSTACPDV